jgi:AcrR family transcriptional regulator
VATDRPAKRMKLKAKTESAAAAPAPGLRQRKREQTRERLTRVAMELFLTRGYEATTLDDIAAAADISRRSFFHYFASKDDVVLAWQDAGTSALIAAITERPADEPMLIAAENAILTLAQQMDTAETVAIAQLKRDNPALRAREQVKYEKMERGMATALAKRAHGKTEHLRARLVAMITTGAIRIAGDNWLAQGAREKPETLVKRTFAAIRTILEERTRE